MLFTSYQQMRQVHDLLKIRLDHPLLLQGAMPRTALVRDFSRYPRCRAIREHRAFWQGIDVQGEQLAASSSTGCRLRCPATRLSRARTNAIREKGGNPFYDYQVPQAALALKQGFGRFIRSAAIEACIVLLDNRITKLAIWPSLLRQPAALPVYQETRGYSTLFQCLKFPWSILLPPAHFLRNYRGKCENLHGHNYKVQLAFSGGIGRRWLAVWTSLKVKKLYAAADDRLDHQFMNEWKPFDQLNPSAENIAKYFYDEISAPVNPGKVGQVRIWETDTTYATYRPYWTEFGVALGGNSYHFSGRSSSAKMAETGKPAHTRRNRCTPRGQYTAFPRY